MFGRYGTVFTVRFSGHDPSSGVLIQDQRVYADGRPVTTITWGGGYARLVHSPDPNDESGGAAEELSEEVWPTRPETTVADEDDFFDTLKTDPRGRCERTLPRNPHPRRGCARTEASIPSSWDNYAGKPNRRQGHDQRS